MDNKKANICSNIFQSIPELVLSFLMALAMIVGYAFSHADPQSAYAPAWPPAAISLVALIVLWVVLFAIVRLIYKWFDKQREGAAKRLDRSAFFYKRCFLISLLVIALLWLPYLVIYFPGALPWDGVRSMNQFITDAPLENHHPVVMNALYAGLMTLGRELRSDNLGLFLIVAFQYLACALIYVLCVKRLSRMDVPRWVPVASLVFFAIYPAWGIFAQAAFKDTLFNGIFCLFIITLAGLLTCKEADTPTPSKGAWAAFLGASLAVCFTRNNGIYIVVPTLIALVLYFAAKKFRQSPERRREGVYAGVTAGTVILVWALVFQVVWPALGIQTKEDKEMMSVPFQQTARCLLEHPDDVTPEEKEAIANILPYDELPSLYNPDLSDPVKESMLDPDGNMTAEERSAYMRSWLSMGLRHPATYIRAMVANTYAYFYPFVIVGEDIDRPVFPLYQQGEPINQDFDVHYIMPESMREKATSLLVGQLYVPVLNVLYSPAPYVWIFLALAVYAMRTRNGRALLVALPIAVLLLTILAGPLNGHLRYVLPMAASLPVLMGCILERTSCGEGNADA